MPTASSVVIAASAEECFRYFADPRRRPEWQSSLRRVEAPDVEPHLGLRWRDVTVVGIKPELEITRMEPYRVWQEVGVWRSVSATLTLRFTAVSGGTRVSADVEVVGGRLGKVAGLLAPMAIGSDLARAARALEQP